MAEPNPAAMEGVSVTDTRPRRRQHLEDKLQLAKAHPFAKAYLSMVNIATPDSTHKNVGRQPTPLQA